MNNYDDIIHLPHHVSEVHPQMAIADRAAQFSPFAALTGYGDAIKETGRRTDERIELNEDAKALLDEKIQMVRERISERPEVSVTYFCPDEKKEGGSYVTLTGRVRKIDGYSGRMVMQDGTGVSFADIMDITLPDEKSMSYIDF